MNGRHGVNRAAVDVHRGVAIAQLDGDGRVQRRRRLRDVLLLPVLVQGLAPLVRVATYGAGEFGDALFDYFAIAGRVDFGVVVALGFV